jgi:hypothetical protein
MKRQASGYDFGQFWVAFFVQMYSAAALMEAVPKCKQYPAFQQPHRMSAVGPAFQLAPASSDQISLAALTTGCAS